MLKGRTRFNASIKQGHKKIRNWPIYAATVRVNRHLNFDSEKY